MGVNVLSPARPVSRSRLYQQVADDLERLILDGVYPHDSRMPSEQELADQYGVSRNVIREALKPKRDEAGKPLKWAAVCCEAAQGMKPGDPVFAAWVRLAATPVREIKSRVPEERPDRGGGRGGGGRGGGGRGGGGGGRGGGGRDDRGGGRGGRRDDRDNSGRASREDMQKHAFGGRVGAKIVIPGFEPPSDEPEAEAAAEQPPADAEQT